MVAVIKKVPLQEGRWPEAAPVRYIPRPTATPLRTVAGTTYRADAGRRFEIECEVEFEGEAHRFTFEVRARDEDEASDRAIEMLDRARVTDTRLKDV